MRNIKRLGLSLFLTMTMLISSVSIVSATSQEKSENDFPKFDAHMHLVDPVIGDFAIPALGFGTTSAQVLQNKLPEGTKIYAISSGYLVDALMKYGLIPNSYDEYSLVKSSNDYALSESSKNPKQVIPFFSLNPKASYAQEEMERCKNLGFKAMKMQFATSNISLRNEDDLVAIDNVFKFAEDNNIVLLIHQKSAIQPYGKEDADALIDLMIKYPNVSVQLAHMGGWGGFTPETQEYCNEIVSNFNKVKNRLYFDISGALITENSGQQAVAVLGITTDEQIESLSNIVGKLHKNIVFGSDSSAFDSITYWDDLNNKMNLKSSVLKTIKNQTPQNTLFKHIS